MMLFLWREAGFFCVFWLVWGAMNDGAVNLIPFVLLHEKTILITLLRSTL